MKNLKKVLALALAFALTLSMFASAAQFTDQADIDVNHLDDVNMLVELGILGGYPDGSFGPDKNITRAEMTKLVYALKYGEDASEGAIFAGSASQFSDVEGNANVAWAKGYINYCATQGIVGGNGDGKFNPNGNVTVGQVAKMLLVALGAKADKEGYGGSNWLGNVVSDAMDLGVFNGWKGDPTAPATRELVATLMANTIFSPVYLYNPVTGVGSQLNPLNNNENPTLGEEILGLQHVEGLVIANDNYFIKYDGNGQLIQTGTATMPSVDSHIANGNWVATGAGSASLANENESKIYYEFFNGANTERAILTINRDLPNDMIGTKVNVYYTVKDGKQTVIGDVVPNSDTVVYNVAASDIDLIPNGESKSTKQVMPYISILADGKEIQAKSRQSEITSVAANTQGYTGDLFADYFYFINDGADMKSVAFGQTSGELARPFLSADTDANTAAGVHDFIADLGEARVENYRVVSLDGGATVSYIFRDEYKVVRRVSAYSQSANTITLQGGIVADLEDEVIIKGDIAKGDEVMTWYDGDMLMVEALEKVSGTASVVDKETIKINDTEYKVDGLMFPLNGNADIAKFFANNVETAKNPETEYTVYNGYVIDCDVTAAAVDVSKYAVVIDSSYSAADNAVKVKLAYSDETVATYEVAKVNGSEFTAYAGQGDTVIAAWVDDTAVGKIVRVQTTTDGRVNLTTGASDARIQATSNISADGRYSLLDAGNANAKIATNEDAVIFMLYGGLKNQAQGTTAFDYNAYNVVAYKISDLGAFTGLPLSRFDDVNDVAAPIASYSYLTNTGMTADAVFAVIPAGPTKPFISGITDSIAYVLDAEYKFDFESEKYYATFKMIGKDGLVELDTVLDIEEELNDAGNAALGQEIPWDRSGAVQGEFARGTLANATVVDGKIANIEIKAALGDLTTVGTDGYVMANIAKVGNNSIAYYAYNAGASVDTANTAATSANIIENRSKFVTFAIDGDEFVEGGEIETVRRGEIIDAGNYNAIIHLDTNGDIDLVISLYGLF